MSRTLRWVGLLILLVLVAVAIVGRESAPLPDALVHAPERLLTRWVPPEPPRTLATVNDAERRAWRRLGRQTSGQLVWSSNREGNHELYLVDLASGEERRLTHNRRVDFFSRFSPDGRRISFLRSQRPWVSFRDESAWDLFVINADGTGERRLVQGAYHPTWLPDGTGLMYVYKNKIVTLDLASGHTQVIYEGARPPTEGRVYEPEQSVDGLIAVTLRNVPQETVGILDLTAGRYTPISGQRACQITWFPSRRQVVWIDNGGHGGTHVMTATFERGDIEAETLIDLPGRYSHEYFPRVTADGEWLVWGAAAEGHEHDRADYELFAWRIGAPVETAIRLTHSPANDQWPDLFVTRDS